MNKKEDIKAFFDEQKHIHKKVAAQEVANKSKKIKFMSTLAMMGCFLVGILSFAGTVALMIGLLLVTGFSLFIYIIEDKYYKYLKDKYDVQ